LGVDGHGASRESRIPKFDGLVPAQEKSGMIKTSAATIFSARFKIAGDGSK
jgi:hypothetical protein